MGCFCAYFLLVEVLLSSSRLLLGSSITILSATFRIGEVPSVYRIRLSDQTLDLIAMRFRSLGEPMRLKILQLLENGEMSVGQLVERLQSSQANVSKHLKVLVDADILSRRMQGTSAYYSIGDPLVMKICETVCNGLTENLKARVESLGFKLSRR
jgi:DNA-binding transcriptional ArsR family regulator